MIYNNLGGLGPNTSDPPEIRLTDVGAVVDEHGNSHSYDLVITNRSAYQSPHPHLNRVVNGMFQIDVACSAPVILRTQFTQSCENSSGNYGCDAMYSPLRAQGGQPVTLTLFDLEGELNILGAYVAMQFSVDRYMYYKTPLRPADNSQPASSVRVQLQHSGGVQFTSTALSTGSSTTDFRALTQSQAASGVQLFIAQELGYLDGTFEVIDTGVIKGFCPPSRQFLLGGDSGLCKPPSPPPPSPPPTSPPPSAPPPCAFQLDEICRFSLIVRDNAVVSGHTNEGAFAVGGTLTDGTPKQSATVSDHSYVGAINGDHLFHFVNGVTLGAAHFPFDWSEFEWLARNLAISSTSGTPWSGYDVHVRCSGGSIGFTDLYPITNPSRSGYNTLVVFNTNEKIIIDSVRGGHVPFSASILAPFSEVEVKFGAGYIDGFLVAKSLTMDQRGGSLQIHAHCFSGPDLSCVGPTNCPTSSSGRGGCVDFLGYRRCIKKYLRGRCFKRRLRTVRCRRACGEC